MNTAFRLLLTFNATSLLVIVFLVKKGCTLEQLLPQYEDLTNFPHYASYLSYLAIPMFLTWLSIILSSQLGKDDFESGNVTSIEHANNSFLPSYLGYFFVALSIPNFETLIFVYGLLFVFTFLSQALYFNPLFLLFGFEFYNITTKNGAAIFLISHRSYKTPQEIDIKKAHRINSYTYMEKDS